MTDIQVAEGDVIGTGEEDFEVGMRQNAMERDAADADNDGKLDFAEFCTFVRDREEGTFSEADLKLRFQALDEDGSGKVDMSEYLLFSLRDALARASDRVCDLFRKWDEDRSGTIDQREFTRALQALGFDVPEADIGKLFESLDVDDSGSLEYKELNAMLRRGTGSEKAMNNLKRQQVINSKKMAGALVNKVAALPPMVKLTTGSVSVPDQLKGVLTQLSVKMIDLFRDWDQDGNGTIDKKEFRLAVAAMGYDASKEDLDILFDELDTSGDGLLEYSEFKSAVRNVSKKKYHVAESQQKEEEVAKSPPQSVPAGNTTPVAYKPRFRRMPKSIIGCRVRVYWADEAAWHSGEVTEYASSRTAPAAAASPQRHHGIVRSERRGTIWRIRYDSHGPKRGMEQLHDFEVVAWEILEQPEGED